MIQVSHLTKEERVEEILMSINKKTSNSMNFSPFQSVIEPSILAKMIDSIEDRVYFISESPAFDFKGRNYTCLSYNFYTVEDFKILMSNNPNDFFVLYNIIMTNGVISNESYMIRGVFIQDPLIRREQIINQILDEE